MSLGFDTSDFGPTIKSPPGSAAEVDAIRGACFANGWQPLAVYSRDKRPVGGAWQFPKAAPPKCRGGEHNTGILTAGLRAADVDVDDPAAAEAVIALIRHLAGTSPLLRRRPDSARVLLVYRAPDGTQPEKVVVGLGDPLGESEFSVGKVEILGKGQQFVAFGTHPEGVDYEWPDKSPATMPRDQAPTMTAEAEAALLSALRTMFPRTAKPADPPEPWAETSTDRKDGFFGRVNDACMTAEALALWVPKLFPSARNYHDGFRISSVDLGRGLEEDISLLPIGLVDFGVADMGDHRNGKRTPVDLVMEWGPVDGLTPTIKARKAAFWLCEAIGHKPEGLGWTAEGSNSSTVPVGTEPEFLDTAAFLARFEPKSFILKPIIEEGRLYTLTGPTGTGKTAIALLIAFHVALNRDLAGRRVRKVPVLFLAGENPDDVRSRWLTMLRLEGIDPADVDVIFVEGRFGIEKQFDVIKRHHDRHRFGLVIVDTLQAFFDGDDSNSNEQMKALARVLRRITMLGPAVLVPAHPNRSAGRDKNEPYGGGALINEVDGNLALWGEPDRVTLYWCKKFRGSFEPIDFALDVVDVPGATDADGDPIKTIKARALGAMEAEAREQELEADLTRLLVVLAERPGASLRSLSSLFTGSGWSKSSVHRRLHALKAQGLAEETLSKWKLTSKGNRHVAGY